ncbi:hypothetical protein FKP32DRAFT_637863 [Trametes sanguinea]|nr:hypothetical protein FKP32DRAFT_637863 [Trametes sanguinea]
MGRKPVPELWHGDKSQRPSLMPKVLYHNAESPDSTASLQGAMQLQDDRALFNGCLSAMKRLANEHLDPTRTVDHQSPGKWKTFKTQLIEAVPLLGEYGEDVWPARAYIAYWHACHSREVSLLPSLQLLCSPSFARDL